MVTYSLRAPLLWGALFWGCVIAAPVGVAAEIHRWTDENGNTHFGDQPPATAESEIVTVTPNVYESPTIVRNEMAESRTTVILYSTRWCGHCKRAREYFRANRISFEEYDVEKSTKGKRDFKRLRARGVPVILVGENRMNGFSEASFQDMYSRSTLGF